MSKPRVTIVVVNWKTPELLAGALRSLYKDSRAESDFEIVVVDNNSGDGSVEMLARDFKQVKTIANRENVGFAKACNQVIPESQADYVLLLNPDTIVVENAVSKMIAFLDKNSNCAAVGPKVLNSDGSLQLACRRSFPTPEAAFFRLTYLSLLFPKNKTLARYNLTDSDPDKEIEVDALSGSCMMLRKSAIDLIGLLDEDIFMFGEDIDWCWRLKQRGFSVRYYPEAVVYHYHGAASRFRRVGATINLHKGMEVFYRKHLASRYPTPFNWLVYLAIYSRAAVYILVACLQQFIPEKNAGVFAHSADPQAAQARLVHAKDAGSKTLVVSGRKES